MLPIVEVDILGAEGLHKHGNALLDSGAQISLIRLPLAEDLRLKGKDAVVTITKVGGEEEEMKTKVYWVEIHSLEDSCTHTIKAVGIPSISGAIYGHLFHVASALPWSQRFSRCQGHRRCEWAVRRSWRLTARSPSVTWGARNLWDVSTHGIRNTQSRKSCSSLS